MANYQTRDLQMRALGNLLELDRVCREHHIRYYISDGTALGAVRHKGFIPWDDDLDVVMPRPDYEVFIQHAKEWLDKPFEIVCPEHDDKYAGVFAKIIDGSTTLIERWGFNQLGGVYIDVFPLDGMSDHKFMRKLQITIYRMLNRWIYLYNRDPYKRGHNYTAWLPLLIQKVFSNRKLHQMIRKVQTLYDYDKATLVSEFDNDGRGTVTKDIFGTPTPILFEGKEVLGPEKMHEYLTSLFGDYMQIPPEDKRRIHNYDFVDFEQSYHDYNDTRVFK